MKGGGGLHRAEHIARDCGYFIYGGSYKVAWTRGQLVLANHGAGQQEDSSHINWSFAPVESKFDVGAASSSSSTSERSSSSSNSVAEPEAEGVIEDTALRNDDPEAEIPARVPGRPARRRRPCGR